jgi:outer membrane protein TolC
MLNGCAVGPDYFQPLTEIAPFHKADAVAARPASEPVPAIDRWWEGFNDPELTRIVGIALEQNLDLAAAFARVEQARAAAREAGAELLPSFDLSSSAARQKQSLESPIGAIGHSLPGYKRYQSLYDNGVAASWEIDLFGGLQRASEAAEAEAEVAQAAHVGTRIIVAADAANAYLRIRGDQVRITVATDQVATNTHLLDLVQQRFAQGLATDREVAQAEALLAGARASLQPLRIDLEGQLNRLDVLMGVQPGTYVKTLSEGTQIPLAPAITGRHRPICYAVVPIS